MLSGAPWTETPPRKPSMYTPDPDFEALKAITRLAWLVDMNPGATARECEAAANEPPIRGRT